jgi:multiple sugar transport system ATP-binding protein
MASVTLSGIRKRYGEHGDDSAEVIKGVDLDIRDGEFMVFVGPSGCGKSTMMRMIAGLEDITAGELRIGNRVANDVPPAQRGVAMVFQSYALYPHMTVAENMGFSLKMAGLSKAQITEQVARAAEVLQITPLLQRLPKALSGGQRQRVAIGRAIVRQPEVFLFDEPLSNLDANLRVQMRVELTQLHKRLGSTMIYVTHDQTEAMTMGDRIAVFNAGVVEQVGAPMDLYQQPANRFVAQFLGSPRMNLLPASMVRDVGAAVLRINGLSDLRFAANAAADAAADVSTCAEVGVRAEFLQIVHDADPAWALTVQGIEHLGDTTLIYLLAPGGAAPLCMKLATATAPCFVGDTVRVRPAPGALHLFNASGLRIATL